MDVLNILPSILIIFRLIPPTDARDLCDFSLEQSSKHNNISSLKSSLESVLSGIVITQWDAQYEEFRAIHNPACCQKPLLIVRPVDSQDVSKSVKFSRQHGLPLSVRSGGHSYTCTSLKNGGIHLDLRSLNRVKLTNAKRSSSGVAVILGPGSTWRRVLEYVPPEKYTIIHGQCLEVGVGGFILGGGINALGATTMYGFGAEQVITYKLVLADGSFATVDKDHIQISYGNGSITTIRSSGDRDLWFGLRGAGSSFGIVTEFLYTVHKRPETLPITIPIVLETVNDFQNLEKAAANTKKYLFTAYTYKRYNKGIFPYNLLKYNLPYTKLLAGKHFILASALLRLFGLNSPSFDPVIAMTGMTVTDVGGESGRHTDPVPAIRYLKSYGVRILIGLPNIIKILSFLTNYAYIGNYEDAFLTPQEQKITGNLNIAGVSLYAMKDSLTFADVFLHHPEFGQLTSATPEKVKTITGCDFCWWAFLLDNHMRFRDFSRIAQNPGQGPFMWDLSCLFMDKNARCPEELRKLKHRLSRDIVPKVSQYQYPNTPSCEDIDFGVRYWGSHYPQLLRIKSAWDPDNVFHHCHSVGSAEQYCCPY
eukprot:GFUD01024724.1.p1 GENE.GFUD01024724.1~~GFUD01024724.1.p1  ORF type:complete len:607 (-),score=100.10 GFUD01024724.1:109-1884(-)